jgi:hypothetical protein
MEVPYSLPGHTCSPWQFEGPGMIPITAAIAEDSSVSKRGSVKVSMPLDMYMCR